MKHFSERGTLNYYQQIKTPNNIISFENHFSKYYESPIFILNTNRGLNIKTEKNHVIGITKKAFNQYIPNFKKEKEKNEGTDYYQYQSFRYGNRDSKNDGNKIIKIFQRGLVDMKNLNQSEKHLNLNQDINSKLLKLNNEYSRNFSEKEILLKNNLDYKNQKKYIKYSSDESDKNSNYELNIISKKKNQRTISNPEINKENLYHGNAYYRRKKYWESKSNSKDKESSKDSYDSLNQYNNNNNNINDNIYNLKENLKININDNQNNYGLPISFISRNKIFYKKLPINQVTFITKKIEKIKQIPILNLSFISKKVNNIKKIVINNICFITKLEKKILLIPKLNISFISKCEKKLKYLPQLDVSFISKKIIPLNSKIIKLIPQENFEIKYFSKQINKTKPKIIQKFSHSGTSFSINKKNSNNNLILETSTKIEKANSFSLEKGIIKKPIIPLLYYSKYIKDNKDNISIKKNINKECFITKLYYQNYNINIINEIILKKPIINICHISKNLLPLIKKPINNQYFITRKYIKNPIKIPLKEKSYISKTYFIKAFKKPIQLESHISKIRIITINSIKHPIISICHITKKTKKFFKLEETINKLEKNILTQSQKNISEPIKLIKKNQSNHNNLILDLSNPKPKKKTRRGGKAARRRHSNHSNQSKNSSDYSQNSNLNISKSSFKSEISIEMNNNFEIKPKIKSFSEDKLVLNEISKKDNNLPIPPKKKNKNEYTLQMEHEVEIQIDENKSSKFFLSQSNLFNNNKLDKFNLFKINYTDKDNQDEIINMFNKQQKRKFKTQKKNYRSNSITFDNINNSFQTPPKIDNLKFEKILFEGKKFFEKEINDKKIMKSIIPIYNLSETNKNSFEIIKNDEDSTKKIILATKKLNHIIKKKIRRMNSMNEKKLNKMKLIKNIDNNKENINKNLNIELNKSSESKIEENKSILIEEEDTKLNNTTGKKFKKILIIPNIPKPKTMSLNFILSIKNYSNSNETYKLPKSVLDHFNKLKNPIYDELYDKSQTDRKINLHYRNKSLNTNKSSKNLNVNLDLNLNNSYNNGNSMSKWARKDFTKENEKAEKFVIDLNNKLNENSIKHDLTSILNIVTIDNFDDISNKLLNILKDSENNQNNFIQVILEKAFVENNFIIIYAKLCRYLCEIIGGKKQDECFLRKKLIEQVKNSFDKINEFDDDKELILDEFYSNKKKFLGLMNLIVELIGVKILSQKIGFYCLNSLYDKYIESNNKNEYCFKYIILEMIIFFISKFGKIIFKRNKNDNKNKLKNFMKNKLSQINENLTIPVHLKYRIINLFEKEKNNWKDSLYEKSFIPKGKNDEEIKNLSEIDRENIVRSDMKKWFNYLNENNINQGNINTKIFNKFNWEKIDNLIIKEKIELTEIIRCFIEISIDLINKKDDVFKANQYIYCIIDYYSQYLNNEELVLFNNKIISLFLEINNLIIDNILIFEILGFLMYNLIHFKLFYIKDLTKFMDKDKESIINIAKVVYFAVCNSGRDKKKLLNDFKQNKLFSTNKDIFNEEISQKININ